MVGLNKRIQTFAVQRDINNNQNEALLAIIPGATLSELWRALGHFETILLIVSLLVLVAGLLSMLTMLISTLNERRREMAVLRAVGVHVMVFLGCLLSVVFLMGLMTVAQPVLLELYGFDLALRGLDFQQMLLLGSVLFIGALFSLIPGFIAYKRSLQDGLTVRL